MKSHTLAVDFSCFLIGSDASTPEHKIIPAQKSSQMIRIKLLASQLNWLYKKTFTCTVMSCHWDSSEQMVTVPFTAMSWYFIFKGFSVTFDHIQLKRGDRDIHVQWNITIKQIFILSNRFEWEEKSHRSLIAAPVAEIWGRWREGAV